jgi:hypothetical protein
MAQRISVRKKMTISKTKAIDKTNAINKTEAINKTNAINKTERINKTNAANKTNADKQSKAVNKTKAANKTAPTIASPSDFIASVEHPVRRKDAEVLLQWFAKVTGYPPIMWGPSIIGFGRYHYEYASGRGGDSLITGFSPRKANLSLYIMPGYQDLDSFLTRLGKHKKGAACLYVNKLADIDMSVLEELVLHSVGDLKKKYETWDQ